MMKHLLLIHLFQNFNLFTKKWSSSAATRTHSMRSSGAATMISSTKSNKKLFAGTWASDTVAHSIIRNKRSELAIVINVSVWSLASVSYCSHWRRIWFWIRLTTWRVTSINARSLFNTFLKNEISFFEAFGRLALWISGANVLFMVGLKEFWTTFSCKITISWC